MTEHGSAEMVRSKIVPRRGDDGGRPLGDRGTNWCPKWAIEEQMDPNGSVYRLRTEVVFFTEGQIFSTRRPLSRVGLKDSLSCYHRQGTMLDSVMLASLVINVSLCALAVAVMMRSN